MWAIDILNIDILEPGSLRVTDDDAKVKLCSEDGSCVSLKGSRIKKPVPPSAASGLSLLKGRGKLRRE